MGGAFANRLSPLTECSHRLGLSRAKVRSLVTPCLSVNACSAHIRNCWVQ